MSDKKKLDYCPSCGFSESVYEKWVDNLPLSIFISEYDSYCPVIHKNRLLDEYVIACQNCGMTVVFPGATKSGAIEAWNDLPRKEKFIDE